MPSDDLAAPPFSKSADPDSVQPLITAHKQPRNRRWRRTARVMVAVDAHNLYLNLPQGARLRYRKLIDFAAASGLLVNASIYTPRLNGGEGERNLLIALKKDGFTRVVARPLRQRPNDQKKSDLDTCIIMDIWEAALRNEIDLVILASGDSDFVPLVEGLVQRGVQVYVVGPDNATAWEMMVCATQFWNMSTIDDLIQLERSETAHGVIPLPQPAVRLPRSAHPNSSSAPASMLIG